MGLSAKIKSFYNRTTRYFLSADYRLLLNYKLGRRYTLKKQNELNKLIVKFLKYRMITKRNCQISYKAILGKNVKFPHPFGIVIGDEVVIGDNVKIWHNVTLGSHGKKTFSRSYPIIERDVKIFAGAVVIGSITIGEGATIGANSVVLKDVPKGCTAVGSPAKVLERVA